MSLGENHENGEHLVTFGFLIEALDNGNYWVAILRGRPSGAKQGSESDFDFHIMYVLIDPQVVKEETKGLARIHLFFYEVFNNLRGEFVLGHEKVNLRARVGQGKARRLVKIKDIVHIVNRIEKRQLLAETSRQIDWSHRWEVMGHWRKFDGIGKDQKGSYCVRGMTWISPHVKGPEDRDLVTKTRFIDPKKGTEEK